MKLLSLREKIGQLVMCGFHGTEPSADIIRLIKEYHVGGIIYFRRNVKDFQQVCRLSADLQSIAKSSSQYPLFIAVDQEGGMVARIDEGITLIPGNMALGATGDVNGVYEAAKISGKELRLMGINMNFAPSVDVNNNPENPVIGIRSYGEDPQLVSDMGLAAIRGYQEAGVSATVKHFPGHGDTDTDSHLDLPSIPHDRKRLYEIELRPFIDAIREGVDAIMSAHVIFPAFEPGNVPATLSSKVLRNLLRDELQYEGVVITDCLEMNAISEVFGVGEGAVMAVEAGADIVLVSHEIERQIAAIESLVKAVESGRISEERINESVQRVLKLKMQRKIDEASISYTEITQHIGLSSSWDVIKQLSEKSITLIKDEKQLPLAGNKRTLVVWPEVQESTQVDEVIRQEITLGKALSEYFDEVEEISIGIYPTQEQIENVIDKSQHFEQVVFASYNAANAPGQVEIIRALAQKIGIRLVVASTRNPYDLNYFPEVKTYLACYENRPQAMKTLAKILTEKLKPVGKLPVSINEKYPYGWSLT